MSREQIVVFRTPQHPSLGTNHWGGASPLLARNIPNESLEQKYTNLNTTRTRDEIFQIENGSFQHSDPKKINDHQAMPSRKARLVAKLVWWPKKEKPVKTATLGGADMKQKRRWLPKMDSKTRWPQGW